MSDVLRKTWKKRLDHKVSINSIKQKDLNIMGGTLNLSPLFQGFYECKRILFFSVKTSLPQ